MLIHYRKENRKIVMGLLSFHEKLVGKSSLLEKINTYESEDDHELFFFTPEDSTNIQGVIGVYWATNDQPTIHDTSLNPSYCGESMGFQMLGELQEKYPDVSIHATGITEPYIRKWLAKRKKKE